MYCSLTTASRIASGTGFHVRAPEGRRGRRQRQDAEDRERSQRHPHRDGRQSPQVKAVVAATTDRPAAVHTAGCAGAHISITSADVGDNRQQLGRVAGNFLNIRLMNAAETAGCWTSHLWNHKEVPVEFDVAAPIQITRNTSLAPRSCLPTFKQPNKTCISVA